MHFLIFYQQCMHAMYEWHVLCTPVHMLTNERPDLTNQRTDRGHVHEHTWSTCSCSTFITIYISSYKLERNIIVRIK